MQLPKSPIVSTKAVPCASLSGWPDNPRIGRLDLIKQSILTNSNYRCIVVQASTNRIIVGNHVWQACCELGIESINAVFVDVDDETATRIVLADNETVSGKIDEGKLLNAMESLIGKVKTLAGTGYQKADYDQLIKKVMRNREVQQEQEQQPDEQPAETDEACEVKRFALTIELDSEQSQQELLKVLNEIDSSLEVKAIA